MKRAPVVRIRRNDDGSPAEVRVGTMKAKHIGESCRNVWATKSYVVKMYDPNVYHEGDRWRGHPLKQNAHEAKLWKTVRKTPDAKYFAPVLRHSERDGYILMKRVKKVELHWSEYPAYPAKLAEGLHKKYRFDSEGQFYYDGKKWVCYDYGFRR